MRDARPERTRESLNWSRNAGSAPEQGAQA